MLAIFIWLYRGTINCPFLYFKSWIRYW